MEAAALSWGLYNVSGLVAIYVDADYASTFPKRLRQERRRGPNPRPSRSCCC